MRTEVKFSQDTGTRLELLVVLLDEYDAPAAHEYISVNRHASADQVAAEVDAVRGRLERGLDKTPREVRYLLDDVNRLVN